MAEITGRILGIDYGEKRIGLALSDPLGMTAQPLQTLQRTRTKEDLDALAAIISEHDVTRIVIGLPLNMDGTEGFMVDSMRAFSGALHDLISLEIIEVDERLTSHQASHALTSASVKGKKRKQKTDIIAAQIILQTHLDSLSN
jgi:putative Holliday junction resolvase